MVEDLLTMAIWHRGKPEELVHHSDQGSQSTSEDFQDLLIARGIVCGTSRSGDVWDNSVIEGFFSTLKTERVRGRKYPTGAESKADGFDHIERFCNPRRRH